MSFLAGGSEMARRIREFDWSAHPFGPIETWPQSLRSALGICLNSAFPTAIYWGPDLRLLYNDSWSTIPGPRHPACLGEPANEVWSDIWHVIEPQFTQVIESGEGLALDDQFLPMRRFGYEEETYWSYNFTPIRGEDGAIEGIFNSGQETTAKVLKQRQTGFLLRLADTLRASADSRSALEAGCRLLGEHLGAIRVGVREKDKDDGQLHIHTEWTAEGTEKIGSTFPWSQLGSIAEALRNRQVVRIDRTESLDKDEARTLAALGAAAVLALPLHRSGELSTILFVHRPKDQPWLDEEVATAEQVFERIIRAIERQRAQEREKALTDEIDHRARNMLGVSQALIRMTEAEDVEAFRESLMRRTRALGNSLQVLSSQKWAGAGFDDLLRQELAPFAPDDPGRITLEGPKVLVPPLKAQPVSMALHELVTNAVKYGGLSGADGTLEISWVIGPDSVLAVDWRERNVTPGDDAKTGGSGFGEKLLKMMIESQLGGSLSREIGGGTFRCRLEIPLPPDD
ncbi:sensor histidine kinase [Ovoidimarina sediminis]|uniref:sensor histidine kinase n=1 Tax=Ovoidimarina sediminis TaxID=3079856 RepID=UPI0029300D88|nr:HWE histidine kinase domain-containing protein [Rhodophyticola sp. MJ-SS7]